MTRWVLAQFRRQPGRALALLLGIVVAATSFTVLSGTAETGRLQVKGTVDANYRPAYDILVRPNGSATGLEAQQGLIRPNSLSGLFGGITTAQWQQIRGIGGVSVAAPIAMGGYVLPQVETLTDLGPAMSSDPTQLVRVAKTWVTDRGRSQAADGPDYIYVDQGPMQLVGSFESDNEQYAVGTGASQRGVCSGTYDPVNHGPFAPASRTGINCWSRVNGSGGGGTASTPKIPPGSVGDFVYWAVPMLIAAVDPQQEAALDGLDHAVVSGRYLRAADTVEPTVNESGPVRPFPVLMPTTTTLDQQLQLDVQEMPAATTAAVPGNPLRWSDSYQRFQSVPGRTTGTITVTAAQAYAQLVHLLERGPISALQLAMGQYFTPGPTTYAAQPNATLAAQTATVSDLIWSPLYGPLSLATTVSGQAFRTLQPHSLTSSSGAGGRSEPILPTFDPVGLYDTSKLPGFSALSQVPLETFSPPDATGADAASRAALGGKPLLPDGNPAGYLQEPPSMITTMAGLASFEDMFDGGTTAAPISSIRVRVAGSAGPDAEGRARVRLIAQQITQLTGLGVDIAAGSSLAPTKIALPAGPHGRPPLTLLEKWTKKNVAVIILRAVDRKSLLLFGLILLVCALFVGNAASAAVRARRTDLAVLAAIGWPPWRLFALVVIELGGIGLVAGVVGSGIALPLSAVFGFHASVARAALAVPAAVVLAVVAGLQPALRAARSDPAAAMRPPVAGGGHARRVRGIAGLAVSNLRRARGRTALGAAAVAVGVAAVVVLLAITFAFRGAVVGTLLGDAVTVQTRGVDYAAVAVMAALAVFAVGDSLYLSVRERAGEFATLQATGWTTADTTRLLVTEGAGIGLLGGTVGAGVGLGAAWSLTNAVPPVAIAVAVAATVAATALCAAAAAIPARLLARLPLARLLTEE